MNKPFDFIPAIDLIDGKCVRLVQGDYTQKTIYHDDPVEMALQFEEAGIRRLHLVDLDGAREKRVINFPVLKNIADVTGLQIDYGGGIRHEEDVVKVLQAGAKWVAIGSLAVKHPDVMREFIREFGGDMFYLGVDVKDGLLAVSGWQEETSLHWEDFIENWLSEGINRFFCTDISRDGMMQGPAVALYAEMVEKFPDLNLTASGGVSNMDDLRAVQKAGCSGAIVGKAIYEGEISLNEINAFIRENVKADD